ncbi:MAG TPA: hypothetical protein VNF28_06895 [Candidatus Binataceae bacterium]|nr:hypothetical protein [Candidatus Binataceae bacterium]
MEKLDPKAMEGLLDLNPQVDREAIEARKEKIAKEGPCVRITGDSASPYGRKRVTSDEQVKWRTANRPGRRRTRYQSM